MPARLLGSLARPGSSDPNWHPPPPPPHPTTRPPLYLFVDIPRSIPTSVFLSFFFGVPSGGDKLLYDNDKSRPFR